MSPRLTDVLLSPEGLQIGVVYVMGWTLLVCVLVEILDRCERRRMDRISARVVEMDRQTAEDAARRVA